MVNSNLKKILANQLKAKLNSPDYVAVPSLISHDDFHGSLLVSASQKKIIGTNINPNRRENEHVVCYDELEPKDWEEIVELIRKQNKEKEQIWEEKKRDIEAKLNSQPNLYYYWSRPHPWHGRANCWVEWKGMRGYTTFSGKQNGRGYGLCIAENHPILDSFSFQTGFYLIDTNKPIERNSPRYWSDGGKSNPSNFHRFVEVGDKITITPFDKINSLIQLFKVQNIKQISLTNERGLLIEYNPTNSSESNRDDNQLLVMSNEEVVNKSEFQVVQSYLQENNKSSLNQQELNALLNTNSVQWPGPNSNGNLGKNLAIGVGVLLVIGLLISLLVKNKRVKK